MEYASLVWMGASSTHLNTLDRVQQRVECIINSGQQSRTSRRLQQLSHRRDVSAAACIYRIHTTECPSTLSELLPQAITRRSNTRLNSLLPTHALALPLPPGVRAHNTLTDIDRSFMNRGVNL